MSVRLLGFEYNPRLMLEQWNYINSPAATCVNLYGLSTLSYIFCEKKISNTQGNHCSNCATDSFY